MSRINTNISSLISQRVLAQNNLSLGQSLERLSTGLRINRGKDDPAGLIVSENLRSDIGATNAAISNAERADQVVNIAEGGLQEVSNLLTELQGLLTTSASSAGLSREEREANQLQIDSVLQTIDRISSSTSFQGIKLLNGNFDYQATGVAAGVTDFKINGAKFETTDLGVDAVITQSAQQAGLFLELGASASGASGTIDLSAGSAFVIEIAGSLGGRELSFASGTSLGDIATAVNSFTEITGLTATVSGTGIVLASQEFGSDEFVSVQVSDTSVTLNNQGSGTLGVYQLEAGDFNTAQSSGTAFTAAGNPIRDDGQDIGGTINGITSTGNGKELSINTDLLDISFTLNDSTAQTLGTVDVLTVTGGGANFQLDGDVDLNGRVSLGIGDITSRKLGANGIGFLDDLGSGKTFNVVDKDSDFTKAQQVVDAAIKQVSGIRGRLGAFQKNVVGATIRSLNIAVENTSAAESIIRDADFATETAQLTRNQILSQASTSLLSVSNSQPQSVLALLG